MPNKNMRTNFMQQTYKIKLVILDPGHFHASLIQKNVMEAVNDTVYVYAPKGTGIHEYLKDINSYNTRKDKPTHWKEIVYTGNDYLFKMLSEHKGNVVILAGNNKKKTKYILDAIKAGYNVLSDKPMAINKNDFNMLVKAYQLAKQKKVFLYDLMTERYDILNIVEKALLNDKQVFGTLQKGTIADPSIQMESVHHFYKNVSGNPLIRPAWYYDIEQQGEGIADVTTHLIDIINWQCFPNQPINYAKDVKILKANHWPTKISLQQYTQSTQEKTFPSYLNKYTKDSILNVYANGSIIYSIKNVNIGIKVIWNFSPPIDGNDTFSSIKKGTKSILKIVQNKENSFNRELYIQKDKNISKETFNTELTKAINKIKLLYPYVSIKDQGNDLYLIDIPVKDRIGHELHFRKVAEQFFEYLNKQNIPEWENINTISKYYITTSATEIAQKKK